MRAIIELQNIQKAFEQKQIDYKTKIMLENKVHEKAEIQNSFKSHKHVYKTMFPKKIRLEKQVIASKEDQLKAIKELNVNKKKTKATKNKKKEEQKVVIDAALIPENLRGLLSAIN